MADNTEDRAATIEADTRAAHLRPLPNAPTPDPPNSDQDAGTGTAMGPELAKSPTGPSKRTARGFLEGGVPRSTLAEANHNHVITASERELGTMRNRNLTTAQVCSELTRRGLERSRDSVIRLANALIDNGATFFYTVGGDARKPHSNRVWTRQHVDQLTAAYVLRDFVGLSMKDVADVIADYDQITHHPLIGALLESASQLRDELDHYNDESMLEVASI